jgi:hypothetical protein
MLRRPLIALLAVLLAAAGWPVPAAAVGGTQVSADAAMYPRVIRLAHSGAANGRLLLAVTAFPPGGPLGFVDVQAFFGRAAAAERAVIFTAS